jgi:predicted HicB family RNase H-like nuclease
MPLKVQRPNAIVSDVAKRLREAASRERMRTVNVWLPEELHRALALARVEDNIAMNEAIREAVKMWLARRSARKRRKA